MFTFLDCFSWLLSWYVHRRILPDCGNSSRKQFPDPSKSHKYQMIIVWIETFRCEVVTTQCTVLSWSFSLYLFFTNCVHNLPMLGSEGQQCILIPFPAVLEHRVATHLRPILVFFLSPEEKHRDNSLL